MLWKHGMEGKNGGPLPSVHLRQSDPLPKARGCSRGREALSAILGAIVSVDEYDGVHRTIVVGTNAEIFAAASRAVHTCVVAVSTMTPVYVPEACALGTASR